jgi:hypothetical protein
VTPRADYHEHSFLRARKHMCFSRSVPHATHDTQHRRQHATGHPHTHSSLTVHSAQPVNLCSHQPVNLCRNNETTRAFVWCTVHVDGIHLYTRAGPGQHRQPIPALPTHGVQASKQCTTSTECSPGCIHVAVDSGCSRSSSAHRRTHGMCKLLTSITSVCEACDKRKLSPGQSTDLCAACVSCCWDVGR